MELISHSLNLCPRSDDLKCATLTFKKGILLPRLSYGDSALRDRSIKILGNCDNDSNDSKE